MTGAIHEIDLHDLKILKEIGNGSFGSVHKARWKGSTVAVKIAETVKQIISLDNEIEQLSRLRHENVISIYGVATEGEDRTIVKAKYLVMEYADGGDLYAFLHLSQSCSPDVEYSLVHSMNWLLQCAKAVHYLHSLKPKAIIHRDLKPLNMVLTNQRRMLKVCDFGTARTIDPNMTDNKGSTTWMAPEVMKGGDYNEKCDIYSWGIILWEVLTRRIPFNELGRYQRIIYQVVSGRRPPPITGCPKVLEQLMQRCWDEDQSKRPSMGEVLKIVSLLYKVLSGGDEPVPCPSSDTESSQTCDDVTECPTSQDVTDFSDDLTEREVETPLITDPVLDITDCRVNSEDFVVVPNDTSGASNLACGTVPKHSGFLPCLLDESPVGTCIDIPHIPRPVVHDSNAQFMEPLNIEIPSSEQNLESYSDGNSHLYLPSQPSEMAPNLLPSAWSPYDPMGHGQSTSLSDFPTALHVEDSLGKEFSYQKTPDVPPRRKSCHAFGMSQCERALYEGWEDLPDKRFDDLLFHQGNPMMQPHEAPPPYVPADDLDDLWQFLEDDLKPQLPIPSCPESQKVYEMHKSFAKQLLQVEERILYLRRDQERLQKEFTTKRSKYEDHQKRTDDLMFRRKCANEKLRKENERLKEEIQRRRQNQLRATGLIRPPSPRMSFPQEPPPYAQPEFFRVRSQNFLVPGENRKPTESARSQSAQELRQDISPRRSPQNIPKSPSPS